MAPYFKRYTMFKVAKQEDIDTILKQYDILRKTAVKVAIGQSSSMHFQSIAEANHKSAGWEAIYSLQRGKADPEHS
jgi:hypothetical protein